MDSLYIYRKPKEKFFKGGIGRAVNSIEPGFIISSFNNDPSSFITIKKERELQLSELKQLESTLYSLDSRSSRPSLFPFPDHSTSKEEHLKSLNTIISSLKQGEKTVCCRVITGNGRVNLEETLLSLASAFPNAMVFSFFSPQSGLWIGASPEKLLSIQGRDFSTMALAGTRPANTQQPWDIKNQEEQQLVSDYISEVLSNSGLSFKSDLQPITIQAGPIEHLCTRFRGVLPSGFDNSSIRSLLVSLSPTPALCGLPKEKSFKLITETETFHRGYYGGYFGELNQEGECILYVILRSIRIERDRWCMFAGGGITPLSSPEEEWLETERKSSAIIRNLVLKNV